MRTKKEAFTLIELLIVIVIIGILATIAVVNYGSQSAKSKRAATIAVLNNTIRAFNTCYAGGSVPVQLGTLSDVTSRTGVTNVVSTSAIYDAGHTMAPVNSGSGLIDNRGQFLCKDQSLTTAVWPVTDTSGKLNGYTIAAVGNNGRYSFITSPRGQLLWLSSSSIATTLLNTGGTLYANSNNDLSAVPAQTITGPSGDITCTIAGCN